MFAGFAVIAQLAIVAHAPDSAFACDAVEVSVAISAPARSFPRLVTPSFAPLPQLHANDRVQLDSVGRGSGLTVRRVEEAESAYRHGAVDVMP